MVLPRAVSGVGRRCHPLERNSFCFDAACQVRYGIKCGETYSAKERSRRNLGITSNALDPANEFLRAVNDSSSRKFYLRSHSSLAITCESNICRRSAAHQSSAF
jgi:hypothetical protein